MKFHYSWVTFILVIGLAGCSIVRSTPKYSFIDNTYRSDVFTKKRSPVYVKHEEDSIYVYGMAEGRPFSIDTSGKKLHFFTSRSKTAGERTYRFRLNSFDVDFLTIPFKLRPAVHPLPVQFNSSLNGAVYLGYRSDLYHIKYKRTPLRDYKRYITHYGVSYGLFNGFGGVVMNPWVTNYAITEEYEGLVWLKGAAGIVAINNFTFGLALGWDHMFGTNRKVWLYQGKPWLGLTFGLNLN